MGLKLLIYQLGFSVPLDAVTIMMLATALLAAILLFGNPLRKRLTGSQGHNLPIQEAEKDEPEEQGSEKKVPNGANEQPKMEQTQTEDDSNHMSQDLPTKFLSDFTNPLHTIQNSLQQLTEKMEVGFSTAADNYVLLQDALLKDLDQNLNSLRTDLDKVVNYRLHAHTLLLAVQQAITLENNRKPLRNSNPYLYAWHKSPEQIIVETMCREFRFFKAPTSDTIADHQLQEAESVGEGGYLMLCFQEDYYKDKLAFLSINVDKVSSAAIVLYRAEDDIERLSDLQRNIELPLGKEACTFVGERETARAIWMVPGLAERNKDGGWRIRRKILIRYF